MPAIRASNRSPGLAATIGPSAPVRTRSPACNGWPSCTIFRASHRAALSGCPRQAAPLPVDTVSPLRSMTITEDPGAQQVPHLHRSESPGLGKVRGDECHDQYLVTIDHRQKNAYKNNADLSPTHGLRKDRFAYVHHCLRYRVIVWLMLISPARRWAEGVPSCTSTSSAPPFPTRIACLCRAYSGRDQVLGFAVLSTSRGRPRGRKRLRSRTNSLPCTTRLRARQSRRPVRSVPSGSSKA